ncbi:MAG: hypothetical protein JSU64_04695 [candidate division WOR-3 bacterium]|nr:MAG: hypothetical protein JSU64_04695 [candidate division WOR-3 bacterium]
MNQKIEEIFDRLLAEVAGGRSVDDCLNDYPDHAEALLPLLQLAEELRDLPKPEPTSGAVREVVKKVQAARAHSQRFSLRGLFRVGVVPVRVLAVLFLVFFFEITTVSLSAKTLPGHMLYPLKRFAEDVQHFLTVDSEVRATIHIVLADRRTYEFACLPTTDAKVNEFLLAEMLQEIEYALKHVGGLSSESAVRVIDQIYDCHQFQLQVLEETKDTACDCNIGLIEEAIKCCLEQRECIECIKEHLLSDHSGRGDPGT